MKFSINQSELQNALAVVQKGISTRSTLAVLSGVYLCAEGDSLTLQTTNLDLSIQYTVAALVDEPGKAVVPGKLFSDIVKNLPDAAVHFSSEEDAATITCDAASFSIKTLEADDFPGFPHVATEQEIEIPFNQFCKMVKRVARSVSKDESRLIMTGILVTLEDQRLRMVATDSYRLAVTEVELPGSTADDFQAVISGSFMQELASMPKTAENIKLALAENQIVVTYHDTVLINRRLEGSYPNYNQLIPSSYATRVGVDASHLVSAVKRASLLGQSSSPLRLDVNAESSTLQISAIAQDVGSAQETLSCECEGSDVEIAFNYSYVLDGLASVETDKVFLELQESLKPGVLKADEGENFLYIIMPVRIS